jgi:hypothetical protein
MEFSFEIERLRHIIVIHAKNADFSESSCCMVDLNIDTKLVIPPETYYHSILKQLYYLLLNDNLKLNVTNFVIFKKYWKVSQTNVDIKYCCWISKITDEEKNKLLNCQIPTTSAVIPVDFDIPDDQDISKSGCCWGY